MLKIIAAVFSLIVLAGCNSGGNNVVDTIKKNPSRGHLVKQSENTNFADMRAGTKHNSHVLIRIFKLERELEVWKKNASGRYVKVVSYPICGMSGALGPKLREGDRQAPEGFYTVTSRQMNYQSTQFLSFNTGYPNQFDKLHGRTGSYLMIHGGCSSIGCYAIEDEPMSNLFAAMRDAFKNKQKQIQVQIYPFHMTDAHMQTYKSHKHYDFWQQLKAGYDRFNQTRQELKVSVVNKRYVVD